MRQVSLVLAATALAPLLATDVFAGVVFSDPVVVIEGPSSAIRLAISPDGNRQLYGEPRPKEDGGLQIRERRLTDEGWSEPDDVSFNTQWNDFDPVFAPDGSGVYFFSNRPGGEGGDDLWFVPLEGNAWGEAVNLGASLNTSGDEWAPTPLAGGRLLFSSDGHVGIGGQDLYIAKRTSYGWGAPHNLGAPVNSAQDDYDAVFLSEGALLLTRSDDPESGSELFYSCRSGDSYTEPQPAGPNVNLGGGWALGPSVSPSKPGIVFFSGRHPDAPNIRIYRARYRIDCVAATNTAAHAQSIEVNVDSSLADYLLETVCSNNGVDEAYLRSSPLVQAQIKHHTNFSQTRNFDALLAGLEAASRCEVPEDDVYHFGPVVENREDFETTVAFLKNRAPDIEAFVVQSLKPFVPEDLDYSGSIVLSIIGNPCGGFASGQQFFLALNCLTADYEGEYSAIKVVSAHEVFHALQHEFFYPRSKEFDEIESLDDAVEYLFRWLMFEGTAEYVVDSRQIAGSGRLTEVLTGFAENGYGQVPLHLELLSYTAEILAAGGDTEGYKERLRNLYELGFSGSGRQAFYYTGAAMAGHVDETYGRDALICIFRLPTEQFIRAYHAAALESPSAEMPPLGETIVNAADRISRERDNGLRFESCLPAIVT